MLTPKKRLTAGNTPARPLRRPIICICNDLYATALRPLRQHARIVRFHKSPSQFLVERLRYICDRERLKADLRVLTLLVDLAGADVRSCLNTLQVGIFSRGMGTHPTRDSCPQPEDIVLTPVHQVTLTHCHGRRHQDLVCRCQGLWYHSEHGVECAVCADGRKAAPQGAGRGRRRAIRRPLSVHAPGVRRLRQGRSRLL